MPIAAQIEEHLRESLRRRIENTASDLQATLMDSAPVKTGDLQRSIAVRPLEDGNNYGVQAEITVPYASYVTEGTGPHEIAPTRDHGLLVFEVGGATVFVHGPVQHPGTTANPFYADSVGRFAELMERDG